MESFRARQDEAGKLSAAAARHRYARCGIFGRSPFALPVIGGRGSLAGGEILLRRRLFWQPCEA